MLPSESNGSVPARYASAIEVLDALDRKLSDEGSTADRRHARKRWTIELTIRVEEVSETSRTERELLVKTRDLSRGGFSFVCGPFLYPGTHVFARVDVLPGAPVLTGVVVYCAHAGGHRHRVGVKLRSFDSASEET